MKTNAFFSVTPYYTTFQIMWKVLVWWLTFWLPQYTVIIRIAGQGVLTKCLSFQLVTLLLQSISPLFFSWTILLHVKITNVTFASWCLRRITSTPIIWHIVGKPYNWLNFIGSKTWKAMEEISWHNSSFPSSVFCHVFPSCGKVYCSSFHCLLSLFLVSFPNNLNYCCQ